MTVPYAPTTWVNGTTPLSQTHMNNLETQSAVALTSWNPDLFTAFVLYGYTAAKDISTANQLDVAAGVAYLIMTDGTIGRIALTSSTQVTSTPSTSYHLYLQPAGTWYWSTSSSPATNSLNICNVTTDGSGNILTVTDARTKTTTLLPHIDGTLASAVDFKGGMAFGGATFWGNGLGVPPYFVIDPAGSALGSISNSPAVAPTASAVTGSGLGTGVYQYKYTYVSAYGESIASAVGSTTTSGGSQKVNLTGITTSGITGIGERNVYRTIANGSTFFLLTTIADNSTTTYTDTTPDGSLGAQLATHPTLGAFVWKAGNTVQDAIYSDGAIVFDSGKIASDGSGNLTALNNVTFGNGPILKTLQSGSANGFTFETWTSSANAVPFSIGGQLNSSISWFDNSGNLTVGGTLTQGSGGTGAATIAGGDLTISSNRAAGGYILSPAYQPVSSNYEGLLQAWNGSAAVSILGVGGNVGTLCKAYLDFSGDLVLLGNLSLGQSATAPATASSGTIATAALGVSRTAPTGNISSVILAAGTVNGQQVTVVNEANFTVTFAASGTSHVADGASDVIPALTARTFTWDGGTSLWYRSA